MATITRTSDRERELMRRSAIGRDQGPNDEQQASAYPRGTNDLELGDPQDPTNVTFPFLRRMRRDHMVAMGLHFIAMPLVNASWYFEADDARAASFADNAVRPIFGRLMLILLRELWAGYSPGAKNFEVVDPAWTYLPGIGQDPKRVWDQGGIGAMVYKPVTPLKPENCVPVYKNGRFNGIAYDGRYGGIGYFTVAGERKTDVDLLHSVWAVHDSENEDGSPFGFPRIAHCAPIFHMYRYIWTLLGRAFENNADPGPVVRYPREDLPTLDADGNEQKNVDVALRIGRRRRSGSTIALPSDPYVDITEKPTGKYKWDIEYPKPETNFSEILEFLGFLESAKLRSLWLQEQGIIEGSGGQSNRNVASEFGDQRDASQIVLMSQLIEVIEQQFVKPLMAMNMPWYEGTLKMKVVGFSSDEDDIVRQILQLAGQENYREFGVDMRKIIESKGVPMLSPADYKKAQEEAAKKIDERNTPPAVTPTQGRRALVTQTGFDRESGTPEMSYVQLGGVIELAGDGDFVASLPKTDAFADRQVVATTRELRATSSAFLTWAYGDFARYLGKQKTLDLAEVLDEVMREHFDETGEELADGDKVRKTVDRIMGGWRPKVEKISDFTKKSRSALGRVYDRTAGIHLGRLGSSAKASSVDKVTMKWLDERGAAMVSSVLETTREQLAGVLADGVRAERTPKQIAADIREHFDGFPAARAAMIARTEVSAAYNYATVTTGMAAGVALGQILDGNDDKPCKDRNGKIKKLADLLKEKLAHPNCTLTVRLLPQASANLDVRYEALDGLHARYDAATETVLLSPQISREDESRYLIALGERFAEPTEVAEELAVA